MIGKVKLKLIMGMLAGLVLTACVSQNGSGPVDGNISTLSEDTASQLIVSAPDQLTFQDIEITNEATVNTVDIAVGQGTPIQVTVTILGTLPDSCVSVEGVNVALNGLSFALAIATYHQIAATCEAQPHTFQETVTLPTTGLAAGTYAVSVNGSNIINTSFTITNDMVQTIATPTPERSGATIEGIVWNDDCQVVNNKPSTGCITDDDGNLKANGMIDGGEGHIAAVEVTLLAGQCPGDERLATTTTDETGMYRLTGLPPGLYCVTVDTITPANAAIFISGGWTYPGLNSSNTTVSLTEEDYQYVDFGWSFQPVATPAPQGPTPVSVESDLACQNTAAYIADVTVPDDTILVGGTSFKKTWRVRNQGDCIWGPNYRLVFDGGTLMDGPTVVPLNQVVEPGHEIDLSVPLVAPLVEGVYRGDWKIQDPTGVMFGSQGDHPFYVQIIVETSGVVPTQVDSAESATIGIRGIVWQDYCGVLSDGTASSGCIKNNNGAYQANGVFDNDEHTLAEVVINLSRGTCSGGQILTTTTTGPDGVYHFSDLEAGAYCVLAMPPSQGRNSILASGRWTYPGDGVGYTTILVESGKVSTADFGWNFWLQ